MPRVNYDGVIAGRCTFVTFLGRAGTMRKMPRLRIEEIFSRSNQPSLLLYHRTSWVDIMATTEQPFAIGRPFDQI